MNRRRPTSYYRGEIRSTTSCRLLGGYSNLLVEPERSRLLMERAGKPITCNPGGVCMFNLCGTYRWTGTGTQIRKGVEQNRKKKPGSPRRIENTGWKKCTGSRMHCERYSRRIVFGAFSLNQLVGGKVLRWRITLRRNYAKRAPRRRPGCAAYFLSSSLILAAGESYCM